MACSFTNILIVVFLLNRLKVSVLQLFEASIWELISINLMRKFQFKEKCQSLSLKNFFSKGRLQIHIFRRFRGQ